MKLPEYEWVQFRKAADQADAERRGWEDVVLTVPNIRSTVTVGAWSAGLVGGRDEPERRYLAADPTLGGGWRLGGREEAASWPRRPRATRMEG